MITRRKYSYFIRLVITAVCVIVFCVKSEALEVLFPTMEEDFDVFLKYYSFRNSVDELLFSLLFLAIFVNAHKWVRAFALFGFVVSFCSFVDKAVLGMNQYLPMDIIILIFAFRLAWGVRKD